MSSISRTYGELLFIVDEKLRDEPTGAILKVGKKNKVVVILKEIVLFLKGNLT